MKKEEVKKMLLETMLGNRPGVNVHMTSGTMTPGTTIRSWHGEIPLPSNAPAEQFWFAYIDYSPAANFEHPVDYVFVHDKTKEKWVVRGTTPPNNLHTLEKIA